MIPGRFIKRPVEVEAVRLGGMMHRLEVLDWLNEGLSDSDPVNAYLENFSDRIVVNTNHGWVKADEGDWIIRKDGEAYPSNDENFRSNYQEAE